MNLSDFFLKRNIFCFSETLGLGLGLVIVTHGDLRPRPPASPTAPVSLSALSTSPSLQRHLICHYNKQQDVVVQNHGCSSVAPTVDFLM